VEVLSPVKTVSWAGYSLDGEPKVTVANNIPMNNLTIANMTIGTHNVTVYANDTYGNIADSQTIAFIIAKPETFPTIPVVAVSVAIAVLVFTGLVVYFKKRKR
jgi:hypothetical protein